MTPLQALHAPWAERPLADIPAHYDEVHVWNSKPGDPAKRTLALVADRLGQHWVTCHDGQGDLTQLWKIA